jgi:hypothetical protein
VSRLCGGELDAGADDTSASRSQRRWPRGRSLAVRGALPRRDPLLGAPHGSLESVSWPSGSPARCRGYVLAEAGTTGCRANRGGHAVSFRTSAAAIKEPASTTAFPVKRPVPHLGSVCGRVRRIAPDGRRSRRRALASCIRPLGWVSLTRSRLCLHIGSRGDAQLDSPSLQ